MQKAMCISTILFLIFSANVFGASYGGGAGTANDPYQISTAGQLDMLGSEPNDWGKSFVLTCDIDMSELVGDFHIIGTSDDDYFNGNFDGKGYAIKNFTLNIIGTEYVGVFGYVRDAVIKNISVTNININASGCADVGGLVGKGNYYCRIANCYVSGSLTTSQNVGGIIGVLGNEHSIVIGCQSDVDIISDYCGGGIIGIAEEGFISECYFTGSVDANEIAGGIAGECSADDTEFITNCYVCGSVDANVAGAIVGVNEGMDEFAHCVWDTEVVGLDVAAGEGDQGDNLGLPSQGMKDVNKFIGEGWKIAFHSDGYYWVQEADSMPILWWQSENLPVLASFSGGSGESGDPYLIADYNDIDAIDSDHRLLSKSFKLVCDVDINGVDFFGVASMEMPFGGNFDGSGYSIKNFKLDSSGIYYLSFIKATENTAWVRNLGMENVVWEIPSSWYAGGIVGFNRGCIDNCNAELDVHCHAYCGGIAGMNFGGEITRCFSSGSMSADYCCCSGIVGMSRQGGKIENCYSLCNLLDGTRNAGICGEVLSNILIENCYFAGKVNNGPFCGTITGKTEAHFRVANCAWDETLNPDVPAFGGGSVVESGNVGLTTEQMKRRASFIALGWDFVGVWGIGQGQTYPYLRTYSAADISRDGIVNFFDFAILAENWLE